VRLLNIETDIVSSFNCSLFYTFVSLCYEVAISEMGNFIGIAIFSLLRPPVGVRNIAMSVSVCLFVCPLAYLKSDMSILQ